MYSYLSNKRVGFNKRVGWNLFLEKNKRAFPFIREVRVEGLRIIKEISYFLDQNHSLKVNNILQLFFELLWELCKMWVLWQKIYGAADFN